MVFLEIEIFKHYSQNIALIYIDRNIDLLMQIAPHWDYTALSLNKSLWEKVFPEFHRASEHTIEILEYFLKEGMKS